MKVFKFGGASVKDATAVRNITNILSLFPNEKIVVVISAMGKTTNALEALFKAYMSKANYSEELQTIKDFHLNVIGALFQSKDHPVYDIFDATLKELQAILDKEPFDNANYQYDQIVSYGELLSTKIISHYAHDNGVNNRWINAKSIIRTDNKYREANILWDNTNEQIKARVENKFNEADVVITQGFIGSTPEQLTTTLGREGSDFTAAIIGAALDATSVTLWKDVPGILTGDPKVFESVQLLDKISYNEAIEMTYYGAKVLHPKTIKPLENKGISLNVKSFIEPKQKGTVVEKLEQELDYKPITILEKKQLQIKVRTKDLSFISEQNLSDIYKVCAANQLKINLMQHSAVSLTLVCDDKPYKTKHVLANLSEQFHMEIKSDVELLTIRHYDYEIIHELCKDKKILMESKSQSTYQIVTIPQPS
jgi:aspartate kinase